MSNMFMECSSLTTLDLSNFITTEVLKMNYMFQDCSSLKILNISNFDLSKIDLSKNIFSGCEDLSLINFGKSLIKNTNNIFSSIGHYITLCANKEIKNLISLDLTLFNITESCIEDCPVDYPFFDFNEDKCVKYCDINDLFRNLCKLNNKETEFSEDLIYNNIINNISDFNISLYEKSINFEIREKNATFKIIVY